MGTAKVSALFSWRWRSRRHLTFKGPTGADSIMMTGNRNSCVRLGGASAYEGDRLEAALELAQSGQVDYLIFDCLSEKTIIEADLSKRRGGIGYDVILEEKLRAVLPYCVKNRT